MQIYDDKKQRIGTLTGYRQRAIEKTLDSGDKTLTFEYPVNGELFYLLKEEYYIRTKEDEFVLKAVETGEQFNKYTATLNVEELEGQSFPYGFASQEQTIRACLEFAFNGTGWTVGTCTVTKKRTIDIEDSTTAWDVLQSCLSTYRCECKIDSIKKQINIYEQIGNDRGCYFVEGLNLRKLTATSDTYDFYTRIIPIGKDGITIEWLNGKEYLENFQYSNKIKTYTWKDERYTNTTSLMEDAGAKLEELSKPYKVYSADVVDLAKANPEYKSILDYEIGDTVRMVSKHPRTQEKQRIVKIVEYPETPEKNTVELSNTTKTFAEVQKTEVELAKTEAVSIANSTTKKILQDYSTTDEVETKITASKESIELSVAEHLKSYVTTTTYESDIEIMSKEINSKVAEDDFGTRITQNAYNVKIAWNKNSNYIQFEENGITLYNGSIDDNKKRTVFDYNGEQFYRDGYYVGKIGTNVWDQDETHKGLVFDLNSQGKYMAFAQRQSEEGAYNTMLCFSRAGSIYNEYGIHLGCNLYGENFTLSKVNLSNFSVNGYSAPTGNLTVVTGISGIVDGVVNYTTTSFPVKNGILTAL